MRRRPPSLRRALHLTAVLLLLTPSAPSASPEAGGERAVLRRIQRECLRAYPADLLAAMTAGAREIPAEVESDPGAQLEFLRKEADLEKGRFFPSLLEELLPAFRQHVSPGSRFLDLGSGDGRVAFLANVLGADVTGIEYDERMVDTSLRALEALEDLIDRGRLRIVQGDFFDVSWSGYDVVYYYDLGSFAEERLRRKMKRELAPEARLVVGREKAPFPGLEVEATFPNVKVYRQSGEPYPEDRDEGLPERR